MSPQAKSPRTEPIATGNYTPGPTVGSVGILLAWAGFLGYSVFRTQQQANRLRRAEKRTVRTTTKTVTA